MPSIILGRGLPVQIDFPDGIERSTKGAIHLLPGGTREITNAELEHITKAHPDILQRLTVQAEVKQSSNAPAPEAHRAEGKRSRNRE
jgi:hypothetical protein